jgi:hypothetical protein
LAERIALGAHVIDHIQLRGGLQLIELLRVRSLSNSKGNKGREANLSGLEHILGHSFHPGALQEPLRRHRITPLFVGLNLSSSPIFPMEQVRLVGFFVAVIKGPQGRRAALEKWSQSRLHSVLERRDRLLGLTLLI